MRVSFGWLKDYIDIRISPQAVAERLTMAGLEVTSLTRIDQDTLLDIEVTPNRTDCLSIIGIAREVAAITGKKLKLPRIMPFRGRAQLSVPIQIQAKSLCPRYLGRVVKNIQVGPSPSWLVQRLEIMGVRAVNNIVDITNFCLLEFGQPLHAFDLDKLQGQRLIVRPALEGERIITIDGVQRDLASTMLVIADKDRPQAIAGIMGAKMSEVCEQTTNVLLESAYFNPQNIHNTSRSLGLATESSYRFERGVDIEAVELASTRATELIQRLAKRKSKAVLVGKLIDRGSKRGRPNKVHLRYARVTEVLGVEVSPAQIKQFLQALSFSVVRSSGDGLMLNIPSFRPDITREADLIEEVARLHGYDNIPLRLSQLTPNLSYTGKLEATGEQIYEVSRRMLSSLGLKEIMTYSLISRQSLRELEPAADNIITITNPLSYEQEILRPTLLVGMLKTLLANINRRNTNLRLFELSRIYCRAGSKITKELTHLCIGIAGKRDLNWQTRPRGYSFFDLKGIVETLLNKLGVKDFRFSEEATPSYFISGRCARIVLGKETLGFLGELNKEILERFDISCPVYACELSLQELLAHIRLEERFVPLPRFPSTERDISLAAPPEVHSEQVVSIINKIGRDLVAEITLFDQYSGEQIPPGFRGLAYCIEYRASDRTLTAQEVDNVHAQILRALTKELAAQIR